MAALKLVLALVVLQVWLAPTLAHVGRGAPPVISKAKSDATAEVETADGTAKVKSEDLVLSAGRRKAVANSVSNATARIDPDGAEAEGSTDSAGSEGKVVFEKSKITTDVNGHETTEAVNHLKIGKKTMTFEEPAEGTRAAKLEDKLEDDFEAGKSVRKLKHDAKKLVKAEKRKDC